VTVIFFSVLPDVTVRVAVRSSLPEFDSMDSVMLVSVFLRPPEGKHLHHVASDDMLQSALALIVISVACASFEVVIVSGVTVMTTSVFPDVGSSLSSLEHAHALAVRTEAKQK
jgi:hypothetical protein